jgi:hypothetical protein
MTTYAPPGGRDQPDEWLDGPRGRNGRQPVDSRSTEARFVPAHAETFRSRVMGLARRLAMYPILGVLALADAFVFWNTLIDKIQADTAWLLLFVTALSVGAVAACHEAGRIMRDRHSGQRGSAIWVSVLVGLWLMLGVTIGWIRANQALVPIEVESELVDPETTSGLALTSTPVQLAGLMFLLYLVTGALAIGHGYRFGNPITRAQRDLVRDRQTFVRELQRLHRARRLAEAEREQGVDDLAREQHYHDLQMERGDALVQQLREAARQRNARAQGDPAATDAIFPPPRHRSRPQPRPDAPPDGYPIVPPPFLPDEDDPTGEVRR